MLKKHVFVVAIALIAVASSTARGQAGTTGRISGTVHVAGDSHDTTQASHEIVGGAQVLLLETRYAARTDERGQFTLDSVPPGQYLLEARRIGFRPARQVIRVGAEGLGALQLHMVPAPVTVDALVIEALMDQGRRTYDLSSLAKVTPVGTANVTTVTSQTIKHIHAKDPWDLVRAATGLEVHEQGQGPGFASDAVIRGFTSDHSTDVALTVDGMPINEPINGHGEGYADWNLIFPSAIADVQVVKGPISPLFGNFAAGGAVNVTTVASTKQTRIALEGGSTTYGAGTLTTGLEKGPWGAFLGAHGKHNTGWRDNSGYSLLQLMGRGNRRLSPTVLVDAGVQHYASIWDSPGYLSLADFNQGRLTQATDPTDGGNTYRTTGRIAASVHAPAFSWQTTAWGYHKYWHLFLTIPELGGEGEGLGGQTEEIDSRNAFGARSLARWTLGATELAGGLEALRHQTRYGIWRTVARTRDLTVNRLNATYLNTGAFGGLNHSFGRALRLEGSLRADQIAPESRDMLADTALRANSHVVLQPKMGAVWYPRGDLQFYLSAARGLRGAPGTISNPARVPVTVWAYESGARFSLKRLDGFVAVFRLDTRNELVFNPVTLQTVTTGHSVREGVEAELRARVASWLDLETHWTVNTKGLYYLPDTSAAAAARIGAPWYRESGTGSISRTAAATAIMHDEGGGKEVAGVANYSAHAAANIRPTQTTSVSIWTTIMGGYIPLGEPDAKTQPFAITNLKASARLWSRLEFTLGVDNVFNERAPELRASGAINPVAPRTAHLGIATDW